MERGRIAVSGAGGFVGRHLTHRAAAEGWHVVGIVRSAAAARFVVENGGHPADTPSLKADLMVPAFAGCRAVVHLAMIGSERPGETYESVNVRGTEEVAAAAIRAGVPRVVLFSGLGVARYGQAPRCTNPYFLSKLAAEVALFRSGRESVVFRPSYVVGPGDPFVPRLVEQMARGEVEQPGDGSYRLQPIAVGDAAAAVLAAIELPALPKPRVFDLVGPEPVRFDRFLERLGEVAGKSGAFRVRSVPVEEADRRAREGGFHGMRADALDCLLCDEVADPFPLLSLLSRPLRPLDTVLRGALRTV
jgi:nucleoside-diphosphate-sugar epimerase